ncbi:MAG: serine/threonine protein kinase [Gemmatimonadales bacterium]
MKVCTTCGKEWPDETKFCPDDGSTLRSTEGTAGDLVGSIIGGRYHITKKLGEGGMGAVYLGEHVKMGRMSAIKVMTEAMAHDADAIARFNREAANAARINHANVCGIYDFGETEDGLIYLAMEFIEGEALTDMLEREGALAPNRAADILLQATDALQAAHDLGIVHRDLKPDNIMIARSRDERDVVKVVDFGIAKAMGPEEGQNVTKTGLVVGTPEYMSPEQLSGDVLDGRSDVYSIALVFYRMLTGVLPFQADSAQETMIKRLTDEPMKLAEALPGVVFPPQLQVVMDKALQRMPGDRYESAIAFGKDVVQAVSSMAGADAAPEVDTDGATMLIDSAEIAGQVGDEATEELAATRVAGAADQAARAPTPDTPQPVPTPAAPVAKKKSPMVAVAAALGLIVVGGGTAVVMIKGGDEEATVPAGPVASGPENDAGGTTPNVTTNTDGNTQTGNNAPPPTGNDGTPSGNQTRDTGRTADNGPDADTRDPGNQPAVDQPPARPTIDVAGVMTEFEAMRDVMIDIIDVGESETTLLAGYRDRTLAIYNNRSYPDTVRAHAADVTLEAYMVEGNQAGACRWMQNAVTLGRTYSSRMIESLGCN